MTNKIELEDAGWNLDNSYSHLPEIFFTLMDPNPVNAPELIILNDSFATTLGLNADALKSEEGIAVFAGNESQKVHCRLHKHTRDISLVILRCWGTAGPCSLGNKSLHQANDLIFSSKDPDGRSIPAEAMDGRELVRCSENISSAKPCMHSVFRQPEALPW